MANLPAEHVASLAKLMPRDTSSSMNVTIDSYIESLLQAGFVPNAKPTTPKRDNLELDPLIEKRTVASVPLVLDILEQHGFVPTTKKSKREIPDLDSALEKRTVPDINLVVSRLAAHGFVPSRSASKIKRDATSDAINGVISQLQALGFNPGDYTNDASAALALAGSSSSYLSATTGVNCPNDDHKTFITGNQKYEVLCSAGINGFDVWGVHSNSFPECLAACSAYVPQANNRPCVGASYLASFADSNCFFKYNASTPGADSRVVTGRKIS